MANSLETAIEAAFNEADQLQKAGNGTMSLVKLKLKEAAGYFSPALSATLSGRLGIGSTSNQKASFAAKADHPILSKGGKGKKKENPALRARINAVPPPQQQVSEAQKGSITVEGDVSLTEKLAAMKPADIAKEYKETLSDLASMLDVEVNPKWNNTQIAAAIKKAAKGN